MATTNKRLVGDDGALYKMTIGTTPVLGGAGTIAKGAWVKIASKATTSFFGGLDVGDYYMAPVDLGATEITDSNDTWYTATPSKLADVIGCSLSVTAEEVDVTVLEDEFKKYRRGKKDATGTLKFNFIQDITDVAGGIGNSFYRICETAADGSVTVTNVDEDPIVLVLYMNYDEDAGDKVTATVMEVELYNFDIPVDMSTAISTESTIRLSGDTDPTMYHITLGA